MNRRPAALLQPAGTIAEPSSDWVTGSKRKD
jgi:hypothetical protein